LTFRLNPGVAEGDLDFRGTLEWRRTRPSAFAQIRSRFEVETDAPQEKLDQLLKLTERYCGLPNAQERPADRGEAQSHRVGETHAPRGRTVPSQRKRAQVRGAPHKTLCFLGTRRYEQATRDTG
jgi:hypothetical protein